MTSYFEKNSQKENCKRIAIDILRYFETKEVYLNGVSSPVFYGDTHSSYGLKFQSEYRKKIREANTFDEAARLCAVVPSTGLARALVDIAAGHASAGLSSTGEGVAELVCADGSVQYAVYNPFCGRFKVCVLSKSGKDVFPYRIAPITRYKTACDDEYHSTVLILALLPFLMEDKEFNDGYNKIMEKLVLASAYKKDMTEDEITEINKTLSTISDNADLRIRRNDFDACIYIDSVGFETSGSGLPFPVLKLSDINSDGHYFPVNTKIGKFSTLS